MRKLDLSPEVREVQIEPIGPLPELRQAQIEPVDSLLEPRQAHIEPIDPLRDELDLGPEAHLQPIDPLSQEGHALGHQAHVAPHGLGHHVEMAALLVEVAAKLGVHHAKRKASPGGAQESPFGHARVAARHVPVAPEPAPSPA